MGNFIRDKSCLSLVKWKWVEVFVISDPNEKWPLFVKKLLRLLKKFFISMNKSKR